MLSFDESDCCGNGCVHCVLDTKPLREDSSQNNKINVINKFTNFTLQSKTLFGELNDVVQLHFRCSPELVEKNEFALEMPSGMHIMMRAPLTASNDKRLLRPYSPFWVDKQKLEFKILVNLSPNGLMSKYISSLKAGDEVEFRGPIGGSYAHRSAVLVLVSQGVAVAPSLPIVREILSNEDDMTRIFQFVCFTDLNRAYFRIDLHEFNKFWNYTSHIYLSRELCDNVECLNRKSCALGCTNLAKKLFYKEKVHTKRLNVEEILLRIGETNFNTACFVVSGSRSFQDRFASDLKTENIFLL